MMFKLALTTLLPLMSRADDVQDIFLKLAQTKPTNDDILNSTIDEFHIGRINENYRHMLTDGLQRAANKIQNFSKFTTTKSNSQPLYSTQSSNKKTSTVARSTAISSTAQCRITYS